MRPESRRPACLMPCNGRLSTKSKVTHKAKITPPSDEEPYDTPLCRCAGTRPGLEHNQTLRTPQSACKALLWFFALLYPVSLRTRKIRGPRMQPTEWPLNMGEVRIGLSRSDGRSPRNWTRPRLNRPQPVHPGDARHVTFFG